MKIAAIILAVGTLAGCCLHPSTKVCDPMPKWQGYAIDLKESER